jgi:hypothetical protein
VGALVQSAPNREGYGQAIPLSAKKSAGISKKIPASLGDAPEGRLICRSKMTGSAEGRRTQCDKPQQFDNGYRACRDTLN